MSELFEGAGRISFILFYFLTGLCETDGTVD